MLNTFIPEETLLRRVSAGKKNVLACQHNKISNAIIDQAMCNERRTVALPSGKELTNVNVVLV